MFATPTEEYVPNPKLVRALERIFILHAIMSRMLPLLLYGCLARAVPILSPAWHLELLPYGGRSWWRE